MKKTIDNETLLAMADRGDLQKDIAAHFGISTQAINRRLMRLRKQAKYEGVMDNLTAKEQKFVAEICSGTSQTQSAAAAFDVGSYDSAKTLGSRLMKDSDIQLAIATIMEAQGLTRSHLITRLKHHVDGKDQNVSLRGVEMGLKLHDSFPASKSVNLTAHVDFCPVDLSRYK
ncbi:MAG: terminase small subunit [Armatimonadota bacterium]